MKRFLAICLWLATAGGLLEAQVTWNQIKGKPFYTQANAPATCSVGSYWFDTDAAAGQNLSLCTATNTWTQLTTGGGAWGSITGTLSDQTDLNTALGGKVGGAASLTTVGAIPYVTASGVLGSAAPELSFYDSGALGKGLLLDTNKAIWWKDGSATPRRIFVVSNFGTMYFGDVNSSFDSLVRFEGRRGSEFYRNQTLVLVAGTNTTTGVAIGPSNTSPTTTLSVLDRTATTGATSVVIGGDAVSGGNYSATTTQLVVNRGSAQGSTNLVEFRAVQATTYIRYDNGYLYGGLVTLSLGATLDNITLSYGNAGSIKWAAESYYYGNVDLGLKRSAAGLLEINNGTAGQYRDLILRNLTLSPSTLPAGVVGQLAVDSGASNALKYYNGTTWTTLGSGGTTYTFSPPLTNSVGTIACESCLVDTTNYIKPSWLTQVDYTIVDGLATSATTDTTNASNITSGTLAGNRMGSVPNIQGNAVNAGTPTGQGQLYAWDTTDSRFELASLDSTIMVSGNSIGVATEIIPQYTYGTSVPGSCSQYGLTFYKTDNGTGQKVYYCNGSTYEQIQSGTQGGGSSVGSWSGTVNFGSINDGACADQTFTATGVTAGAILTPGWPSGLESGLFGSMMASAADTVKVRLCNMSGAAVDPASATFAAQLAQGYLNASSAINFGSITDGACATNTLTVTGAATGDKVSPSWPSGLESGLFGIMSVTAADTVTVRLCNLSGSSVDPASATFGAAVLK